MKQIIHIFRKDVRHLWREIAASVALVAAFVWCEPATWVPLHSTRSAIAELLSPLLPISWWLLVVRVVQDELLVGDRQFWVTRPYDWKKLLAAKLLFVVTFVNLPLVLADVMLLWIGGFPDSSSRALGVLWMQLLWAGFVFLPITALATVTANVGQIALAIFGVALYFVSLAFLSSTLPTGLPTAEMLPNLITMTVLIGACVVVTVWQYARRQTVRARGLLVGALLAVVVVAVATPHRLLVARTYPEAASGQQLPAQLAFDPVKPLPSKAVPDTESKSQIAFQIPLRITGVGEGTMVVVDGTRATIEGLGGFWWDSGWRQDRSVLLPNLEHFSTGLMLDKERFERLQSAPVKLHISFALTAFRDQKKLDVVVDREFAVKDVGRCSLEGRGRIRCRYALQRPSFMVTTPLSAMTCAGRAGTAPAAGAVARSWEPQGMSGPAEFGMSPVKWVDIFLRNWEGDVSYDPGDTGPHVCPGTPLTFTFPVETGRTRAEVEIDGLKLSDYSLSNGSDGATGFGVVVH